MDRGKLEEFISYILVVANKEENQWFKDKLLISLDSDSENKRIDFTSYFRLLKIQLKIKANNFYKDIPNPKLKTQLVKDCLNMYWYQINNDVIQQFNYAFFQFENLLNYYIYKSNAYEKIKANKNYFIYDVFDVICYKYFFYETKEKKTHEQGINKISIWAKVVYWGYDTGNKDFLIKNNSNFSNLINIRNQNIHRNSQTDTEEPQTINFIKINDFTQFGFYINILKTIAQSLNKIGTEVVIRDFEPTKPKLSGLTIVGKIDLSKIKK